ncbi:MAG: type 4a pilus biogenesis protein PilO [Candidatus Omnitrophota bacterium]
MNGLFLKKLIPFKALERLGLDKKKIFLIALICIIFLYLDFSLIFKSQIQALKTTEPKIAVLKRDLDNFKKDTAKMEELKKKQIEPVQKAAAKIKKIISSEQLAILLQDLSDIANKNEVKIEQIKPSKDSQTSKQDKVAGIGNLQPVLITLDLTGDYHHFGKFINDIEGAQSFIAVQSMKISSGAGEYFKQKVNLVLRVYVKK